MASFVEIVALICLLWAVFIFIVQSIGIAAIFRYFSRPAPPPISTRLAQNAPTVTIIRPVKGLEPRLYECIASTFKQDYPVDKISIRLCVERETDPAYPLLLRLVHDFPAVDAQVLVESQDPVLHGSQGHINALGPNPKIRNISRAYRESKGEIVWIIDCNVWVAGGVLGRMVDKLMGYAPAGKSAQPYKFVHQMPLLVDSADLTRPEPEETQAHLSSASDPPAAVSGTLERAGEGFPRRIGRHGGGRLDEMFFATTHAKFYGAINSVGIAPCIVGKSNMFRKAHLDQVTRAASNPKLPKGENVRSGIDFFSSNICEDHLIGDLLWRAKMPGYLNHGIVWGDLVIQPMADMSLWSYAARRCRWLRARKFTVPAATLVEPGVESFVCCAYFAFSVTTLPWFRDQLGIPQTWKTMSLVWCLSVTAWMLLDWQTFCLLHSGNSIQVRHDNPLFVRGSSEIGAMAHRHFLQWLVAWLVREAMALPIWTWAVLCGTTVTWRGKTFRVSIDTTVHELHNGSATAKHSRASDGEKARQSSKDRLD